MPHRLPPRPEADDADPLRREVAADPLSASDTCHLLRLACQIADYDALDRGEGRGARVFETLLAQSRGAPRTGST